VGFAAPAKVRLAAPCCVLVEHGLCEPVDRSHVMVLMENEDHGRGAVRGEPIHEIACRRWLEAVGENLDVTQQRACASQLLTEIANFLRQLVILLQAFEHDIPAVRVAHGRLE